MTDLEKTKEIYLSEYARLTEEEDDEEPDPSFHQKHFLKMSLLHEDIGLVYFQDKDLDNALKNLQDGDIIFFVKDPARRAVGEVVGHMGIIEVESGNPKLIHASGSKKGKDRPGGGVVKKVDLLGYLTDMKFIGVMITRFS